MFEGGDPAGGSGASHAGFGKSFPSLMTRRRPDRSVTRIVRASGNAMPNGCTRPSATSVTLIRCPVPVSNMNGPGPPGPFAGPCP